MKKITALFAVAVALAVPAFAGPMIYSGIDVWRTPGQGETFSDFASQPLPAGFLCEGAAPFTGRVEYKGLPIATDRAGALGQTDTIIHRLDDAEINARGVASTRIQVRALNLVSRAPIQTNCGAYNVRVSLDGRQPTTLMKIFREGDEGGRFLAPLALRVKLTFTPVEGGEARELSRLVRFNSDPRFTWSMDESKRSIRQSGWIKVDTDGDNRPDTFVPGTSNFVPGLNGEKAECASSVVAFHDSVDGHGVC
jgi:hypothetical protein